MNDQVMLPQAKTWLQEHLHNHYLDSDWRPILTVVMTAEGDATATLDAVGKLASTRYPPKPTIKIPAQPYTITPQVAILECNLMASIAELHIRHQIFGDLPSLEDLLDPAEEKEVGDSPYQFEGGDAEIVAQICHQMAVDQHNIVDVDSEDEHKPEEENGQCYRGY